jgi:hypothetical protein
MVSKQLVFVVILGLSVYQVSGSTIEDAETALKQLDILYDAVLIYEESFMSSQIDLLESTLDQMIKATKEDIDNKIAGILKKITSLTKNVESIGTNVDVCSSTAQRDLEEFSSDLNSRLKNCYDDMLVLGGAHLLQAWRRNLYERDINFRCTNMSFIQCVEYESEGCVDEVLSTIDKATKSLATASQVMKADLSNQIIGTNFPCRQMIEQEWDLYPSLILNFVQTCLESVLAGLRSYTC